MGNLFAKPFALGIGPQGCGTDKLHAYFKGHAAVVLPDVQEIFYFDRHVQRGPLFYKEHFDNVMAADLVMELTTTAFDHPQAAERAADLLGKDTKIFCLLRDPVERSFAVYKQYLQYGIVKGDIEAAVAHAPQILHASRYVDHINHWQQYFEDIHFLSYEQLETHYAETVKSLCAFLDIGFKEPKRHIDWHNVLPKIWFPNKGGLGQRRSTASEDDQKLWLSSQLEDEKDRFRKLISLDIF